MYITGVCVTFEEKDFPFSRPGSSPTLPQRTTIYFETACRNGSCCMLAEADPSVPAATRPMAARLSAASADNDAPTVESGGDAPHAETDAALASEVDAARSGACQSHQGPDQGT